ncbi:hypothetical protein DFH07DRAFT_783921 [Mycena maculata]|uniref:Uncharacterized protein n=1 Tax=Mycena maculata TaxID=230809 RepID=A0AAD7HJE8_9AGAR|nr:hypothetical protein DFH07DRAFT_783921 [Mycena maculata]
MSVSKEVRKFRIGMALVFSQFVLAFVTTDLLFQWTHLSSHRTFTPPQEEFLIKKSGRACDIICNANKVFYGIGVDTVMELFFMAVSRCFLYLYWGGIGEGEANLWKLLKPCIHYGVLAPTRKQRLRYADWLYVWAKDRVLMSARMAYLVDAFHDKLAEFIEKPTTTCRNSVVDSYDIFEPTLISPALKLEHFGTLIFGRQEWLNLGHTNAAHDDRLTELYRQHACWKPHLN